MADLSVHIKQLNTKLQQLLKQCNMLSTENKQKKLLIASLQEIDQLQLQQISSLQQERLLLKASIDNMDEADKKQMEQKINGYLKNIDKAISLLSHKSSV